MDLADRRIIVYETRPRPPLGTPRALLDAALAATSLQPSVPLLIPLRRTLLEDPEFDPCDVARAAHASPSEIVWMFPTSVFDQQANASGRHLKGSLAPTVRRHALELQARGFRIGLDGVRILELSWQGVAELRPNFLSIEDDICSRLGDPAFEAALAGVLTFVGRLGGRAVARGVEAAEDTEALVRAGVFYGLGRYLQAPVVLDPASAIDGDQVVRPSWFRGKSVRSLPSGDVDTGTDNAGSSAHVGEDVDHNRAPVLFFPSPAAGVPVATDESALPKLISECARRFFLADSPAQVLEMLAEVIPSLARFDRLAIFEADWSRYMMEPRVLIGDELETLTEMTHPLGAGITGWAFLRGEPYYCPKTAEHPEAAPIPGEPERDESLMVVPLTSGNKRIGVLDVWRDGVDQFTDTELQRCALLAAVAADAWRHAAGRTELEQRVVTDTGTGLLNKRWWDELAPREAAQALRTGSGIAILVVDLDGFKSVNDTFGHAIGDMVLSQVARSLVTAVRPGDAAIRYGGDEFLLMLRDCDEAGAVRVAEDVQVAVGTMTGPAASGLSASVGIAMFPDHGQTLDEVAQAADTAMYQAKGAGGDGIATFSTIAARRSLGTVLTGSESPGGPLETGSVSSVAGEDRRGALGRDIAEQHRRLAEAQRLAMIGSFEMELNSGELEWSAELRRIFGIPVDERPSVSAVIDRIHPDDVEGFANSISAWIETRSQRYERTFRIVRGDGSVCHVYMRVRAHAQEGSRRLVTGTIQDVTDRVDSEEARRTAEEQFTLAFEQGAIGMLTTSLDRVITRVNPALCELLGRPSSEILGKTPDAFAHPDDLAGGQPPLSAELLATPAGRIDAERRYVRADGDIVYVRTHLTLVRDSSGQGQYVFAQIEDVTASKRQEDEIRRLALEDPLTGLPNRQVLHDRIHRSLRRTRRSNDRVALLLVGIDHFKRINDSRGTAAGDRLLMQAGRRIADGMRDHDTVARLSGDEFVLLCDGVKDVDHARALSDRLARLFVEPFILDDDEIILSVSCGITLATGSETPEELLRDAEAAMHLAKEHGPGSSKVFDEAIRTRATGRLDLETALRHAVDRHEIQVAFQPVISFPDEVIVGLEALARWNYAGEMISPAEFIPIAEETGLIAALGDHMLDAALEQVARWRRDVPEWKSIFVAVNLSPKQLVAEDLLERCLAALERHHLTPDSLRLEVTESTLMDDVEFSTGILNSLSEAGILIALDDFGTGFSSLSRLKHLPVATLKIDRSFVDGLGTDQSDSSIVQAIASLGHALNLELCAEGVEQPLQRDELVRLGCHQAQGYLWAPALYAADFLRTFGPGTVLTPG
jgi:diguanylate cyclase (GGDEF)-like protein/PAS domain S-box-containing protein